MTPYSGRGTGGVRQSFHTNSGAPVNRIISAGVDSGIPGFSEFSATNSFTPINQASGIIPSFNPFCPVSRRNRNIGEATSEPQAASIAKRQQRSLSSKSQCDGNTAYTTPESTYYNSLQSGVSLNELEVQHEDLQRISPPDPKRRKPMRRTQTIKTTQTKFAQPAITKPSIPKSKRAQDDARKSSTSGLYTVDGTTTQDLVRSAYNGLAQTTLEKLAAFRYGASSTTPQDSKEAPIPTMQSHREEPEFASTQIGSHYGSDEFINYHAIPSPSSWEIGQQDSPMNLVKSSTFDRSKVRGTDAVGADAMSVSLHVSTSRAQSLNLPEPSPVIIGNRLAERDFGNISTRDRVAARAEAEPYFDPFDDGILDEDFADINLQHQELCHVELKAACVLKSPESITKRLPATLKDPSQSFDSRHVVPDVSAGPVVITAPFRDVDDNDDEYFFSEDEEAGLMLFELQNDIQETRQPDGESLQFASDEESRYNTKFDSSLQFSSPTARPAIMAHQRTASPTLTLSTLDSHKSSNVEEWAFLHKKVFSKPATSKSPIRQCTLPTTHQVSRKYPSQEQSLQISINTSKDLDYLPLSPFVRPEFPKPVRDRSPVVGLTSKSILRTCFRIAEALKAGSKAAHLQQDAIIELYARIVYSSREAGTLKQHFQFKDLFHDRPPFQTGILENYKVCTLQDTESRELLNEVGGDREDRGRMVRCLGRLKREVVGTRWVFHVMSIRTTDWEEVGWTKRVAGAGMVKRLEEDIEETIKRRIASNIEKLMN